jgi:ATP-dependent DNA helicase RecG
LRPDILFPLFAPVGSLPGVGPRLSKLFDSLAGGKVLDLCWHLPSGIVDRRYSPKLGSAVPGRVATVSVVVGAHRPARNKRQPYRISCHDETGELDLVFFHAHGDYLTKTLPEGQERAISGRIDIFSGRLQMTHPDHIAIPAEIDRLKRVEPVYPMTAGLTQNPLAKAVRGALERAPELPEWLDPAYRERQGWASWHDSLQRAHAPADEGELSPLTPARARLAYDELLANQLAIALVRLHQRRRRGRAVAGDGRLRREVLTSLPFALTASQDSAIEEILADLAAPARMLRLLQGDVGSGKTLVAFMAMLNAVEAGHQAAMMAPTEILARQHHATLAPLAAAAGIKLALLTGRDKGKARQEKVESIASGMTPLVVGTHALFQSDVAFRDLALVVIDEQHRFGVHQRLDLADDGNADPAHPDAHRLWRHAELAPDREAAGPQAGRHAGPAARPARRGHRRGRPGFGARYQGLLGLSSRW